MISMKFSTKIIVVVIFVGKILKRFPSYLFKLLSKNSTATKYIRVQMSLATVKTTIILRIICAPCVSNKSIEKGLQYCNRSSCAHELKITVMD